MPLYEYLCLVNGHSFEVRHPITQEPVKECPLCGSEVRRIIHPVGIVFKGSGFYATDSRGKGMSTKGASSEAAADSKKAGESPAREGKSDKGEPKKEASQPKSSPATSSD